MFQNPAVPLAPMTPHTVISAFNYLRAVQAGDTEAAAEFLAAEPAMPALLVDVAERIVVPVTARPGTVRRLLRPAGRRTRLRDHPVRLAQGGPDTAKGIAQGVIRSTKEVLTQDHEDVADILRHMEAVGLGQALEAHPPQTGAQTVRLTIV